MKKLLALALMLLLLLTAAGALADGKTEAVLAVAVSELG